MTMGSVYAIIGAALAVIVSGIGSAIGVGRAGQASSALLSKQPDKFGTTMILQVMPSTQGLYGFVVAFMMLIKLEAFGSNMAQLTDAQGWIMFAYCLPIAIVGLVSAIMQGNVAIGCINLVGKQENQIGHAIPMLVLVEIFAIFAFIVSILGVMLFDISIAA
ncbi:MAG: V-type ATP synthase subunit K [Clostridiales bacterium]|nr:V-type ATP synthase subunit K [Clostridiales bacterium]